MSRALALKSIDVLSRRIDMGGKLFGLRMCAVAWSTGLLAAGCGSQPAEDEEIVVATSALTNAGTATTPGDPFPGLPAGKLTDFQNGKAEFITVDTLADGLGPVFNEQACGNCHTLGGIGGAGKQFELRAGKLTGSAFDPLVAEGGQLFDLFSVTNLPAKQRKTIPNCLLPPNGEPVGADAPDANVQALRRTTALFGLGLVDATPDATFTALAAAEDPLIRGRVASVPNLTAGGFAVGKFGWKGQVANLHDFSGDAYLNEMGITNPLFPVEQAPGGNASLIAACDLIPESVELEDDGEDLTLFTNFMTLLAPIGPLAESADAAAGDALFTQIGCDGCHDRTIASGASPIAALNNKSYHPFSDFLLHDMGSLGDNIAQGNAGIHEVRTAPLWGLRLVPSGKLLHDGRAGSVKDAIQKHSIDGTGQAAVSVAGFQALTAAQKQQVLTFLATL
jgi:CxxC motif-containing protein (DUF1111 family)